MLRQPFVESTNSVSLWYADGSDYCLDISPHDPPAKLSYFLTSSGEIFRTEDGAQYILTDRPNRRIAPTITWHQILFTGESLATNLTSEVSKAIGRSERGSAVVQGEVSGEIRMEAQANTFLRNAFVCALMDDRDLAFGYEALDRTVLKNGSRRHPLMILKRIENGDGLADYYLYLGVEIDTLSVEVTPQELVKASVTLIGRNGLAYLEASPEPETWRFICEYRSPLMSGYDALRDFRLLGRSGRPYPTVLQKLSFSINNQLRGQYTVGNRRIFPEGIGVGRIKVTYAATSYYTSQTMAQAMLDDDRLEIAGRLWDSGLGSFGFLSRHVKPITHSDFVVESQDSDLLTELDLHAFDDDRGDTIAVLIGQGREVCGPITYFRASDGTFFLTSDGKPIAFVTYCVGDQVYYLTADGQVFADSEGRLILVDSHRHFDMEGAKLFLSDRGRVLAA